MCGIFAWLTPLNMAPPILKQAREAVKQLAHRGPDGDGEWVEKGVYLGHRRLSIIDLSSAANQPFVYKEGNIIISYNGEIYNYLELAEELKREGISFRTGSDTEVFAAAYVKWGVEAFSRFDGMFSAAIYDISKRSLVLVRDPIGQKPLYYYHDDRSLVCASELRSLLSIESFKWVLNKRACARFLSNACFMGDETPVRGILKLPPGHYLVFQPDENLFEVKRYWSSYPGSDTLDIDLEEATQEFDRLFGIEMNRVLRSDVPVGVFLSGGLDSSLTAIYAHYFMKDIRSYTLGMEESDFDERLKANRVVNWLGKKEHRVFELDGPSALNTVNDHFDTCDEPHGDPGFINTLFLAEKVRPEIRVGIAGDGADELFWGYETFRAIDPDKIVRNLPAQMLSLMAFLSQKIIPVSDGYLDMGYKISQFLRGYPSSKSVRPALWLSSIGPLELTNLVSGIDADFFDPNSDSDNIYSPFLISQSEMQSDSLEDRLAFHYQRNFLPDFVACHTDRAAMQKSLEVRSPFLAPDVISFANRLPSKLKRDGVNLKVLLRRVLEKKGFPTELIHQKKQGFTFPVARALKKDLNILMGQLLGTDALYDGLISRENTELLFSQHLSGTKNNYRILFNLMALSAWRIKFPQVISSGGV